MMFSFHALFVFLFLWLTAWTKAVPLGNGTINPSADVVWETLVVTATTVICPTTLGKSTSIKKYETTTVLRPSRSTGNGFSASTSPSVETSSTVQRSTVDVSVRPASTKPPPLSSATYSSSSNISTTSSSLKPSLTVPTLVFSCSAVGSTSRCEYVLPATSRSIPTLVFSCSSIGGIDRCEYVTPPSSPTYVKPSATAVRSSIASSQPPPSPRTTSMGQSQSSLKPRPSSTKKESWRSSLQNTFTSSRPSPSAIASPVPADNIFVPIQQDNILPQIPISQHHPVARLGILDDENRTLETNKFYANLFLGEQNQPVWTHPYSIFWGKGGKDPSLYNTWGMNVAHTEVEDLVYGDGNPAKFFINPRKQSLILGAREFDNQTVMTTDTHQPFSVNINLQRGAAADSPKITFPVVQGMSFVTGGYKNAAPMIQTGGINPGDGFKDISNPIMIGKSTKYRIKDVDGRDWVMYVNPAAGVNYDATKLTKVDNHTFILPDGFTGTIQVAKNPLGKDGEALYDKAYGTFVAEATLAGTVNDIKGTYSFSYTKIGASPLLMFLLPHHIQSLDPELKNNVTNLQLHTTTKGMATAVWGDSFNLIEQSLPTTMGFAPWTPSIAGSKTRYPPDFLQLLAPIAERDLRRAISDDIPQDSMYYAGKSLAKYATILWCMKDVLGNASLLQLGLDNLKGKMNLYVQNKQKYPLYYDDSWKGVVSSAGFNDPGADFGNTYYNDHHFHFGYFVYASAVIGYLDPSWLEQGDNKAWTNMLVKDFAESDYNSRDYPFGRSFDWWHGHSWAKGLFESADGKDQESSGEDGFAAFAIKMWGKTIGDANMEKRGNLMLAIQARSFNNYFYLASNNTNQPPRFIDNKVTGILFENKIDYTTYFGTNPEYIHGIHMLPISPASTYLRPRSWVKEEWDAFFSNDRALVDGGWRGILYADLAIIDAKTSFAFFRDGVGGVWDDGWIDGGASRTWYLVWSAALGGVR